MKTLLTLFILLFSSSVSAEDISDFEIEGISIGNSLLDYMSEEEIKTNLKNTRYMYEYLKDDFGEVYLYQKFQDYDFLSFYIKSKDKNYIIQAVRGIIDIDDLDECILKRNTIDKEISNLFYGLEKNEREFSYTVDPSGKSKGYQIYYSFPSNDLIVLGCADFEKSIKEKNNWSNGFEIVIQNKYVTEWFSNPIN